MLTRRGPHALIRSVAAAVSAAALAVAGGTLAGCHTGESVSSASGGGTETAGGRPESSKQPLKVEAVSSAQVAVSPPVVLIEDGVMRITGTVHRQPGVAGPLQGRVDIDLIGPDGLFLDKSLHAPVQGGAVPGDANTSVAYAPTPFGYVPPAGSILRARFVDRQASILEDLKDGDLDVNGNGGHTGDGVSRSASNGSMPLNSTGGGGIGQ